MVSRLCSPACDSELMHSQLEGGPLHSKMCRCSVGTCHNPIAVLKSSKNLLTFRFLQNVVKCAICRFRRRGFFCRRAGFGNFKVANIDTQGRPPEIITARSITFWSSRIFPGQWYRHRASMAADGIVSMTFFMRVENCCVK
jgi:hypothetical protein